MTDSTTIKTNIRLMTEHADRFEMMARSAEDADPPRSGEAKHLRDLSRDAQHQIEYLQRTPNEPPPDSHS
jgi:hypothetical protein